MEILISLWLVLMWKPLCEKVGKSTAWLWAKRTWRFLGVCGIFVLISVSMWSILRFGPATYFNEVKLMFTKSDEQRRSEREERYKKQAEKKREAADKRYEERHKNQG